METPEFCHKFSLWAWYSLDDVIHLQNGNMCPRQQDDSSTLTAEIFFWKYSQTTPDGNWKFVSVLMTLRGKLPAFQD